jgi:hypothetical protein
MDSQNYSRELQGGGSGGHGGLRGGTPFDAFL